jgi:nucleotide-binding universal stress UspA family protein
MKKILVVFNAINYSNTLAAFARNMARLSNSTINAVFLTPSLAPVIQYPFPNDLPLASSGLVSTPEMMKETTNLTKSHVRSFREGCASENINCKIEDADAITLDNLVDYSAFTDLILCDAKEVLGGISVQELLVDTHCPVLLVPGKTELPTRAVLCYDESFSSILAMKMYSYLFPEWKEMQSTVLSIYSKGDNDIKYRDYLNDWLPEHFLNLQKLRLQGDLQTELLSFIRKNDEPTIVVMGAFGRNAISRLFHRSLAHIVMEETNAFVFIMHE